MVSKMYWFYHFSLLLSWFLSMNPRNFMICANVFQLCQGTVHLHNLCQFLYIDNYLYQENNFKENQNNLHV